MIRPFTLICMVSAFGAGLYLYQSKHQAQILDREIMRTIKQTEATRERTGMLRAEWALLNEPDRLAELAKAHTSLQTLKPTQFAAMADLGARLPAPVAQHQELLPAEPEPEEPIAVPVAQAAPAAKPPVAVASVEAKPKPEPKVEIKPAAVVAEAKPARAADKPAARTTTQAVADAAPLAHVARPRPAAEVANNDAVAPGTVGAAVMRAMRSQNPGGYAAAPSAPPPARVYAQQPAYVQPVYAQPAYSPPAYAQPAYAQPAYAPAASMLGGRSALPPPVPFASR